MNLLQNSKYSWNIFFLQEAFEFVGACLQKNTKLYHNRPGETKNQTNLHLEPYKNGYWINYVNIYLCHQHGISVAEAQVSFLQNFPRGEEQGEMAVFTG